MAIKIPTISLSRLSKMYPNSDLGYTNIPSGNPARAYCTIIII
jgi:hypothetical protein